jgi:hypothetical protein
LICQSKNEIRGEALAVATNLLIEPLGAYRVERGKVGVEEHFLAAHEDDALANTFWCNGD